MKKQRVKCKDCGHETRAITAIMCPECGGKMFVKMEGDN